MKKDKDWYEEEEELLYKATETRAEGNIYSFEGLHHNCYIRLECNDVKDIIKSLKELYEDK